MVSEMRATLTSNVGACLHNLGLVDDAVQYYERALQEFKAVPFTLLSRLSPIRCAAARPTPSDALLEAARVLARPSSPARQPPSARAPLLPLTTTSDAIGTRRRSPVAGWSTATL